MTTLSIAGIDIRQDTHARFSLNDLHRAAGGEKRHQPANWLALQQTHELIEELAVPVIPGTEQNQPVARIQGGDPERQGTYVVKELVYAYAMWISASFHLQVIRTFDAAVTGQYTAAHVPPKPRNAPMLTAKLQLARAAKAMLRMSATSTSRMLSAIAESEGISPKFLPSYVDEPLTRALTALLKEQGSPLASKVGSTVNPALAELGILEHLERTGGKGDIKKFWSLTTAGLAYGRNETSPQNPRETQPLYFVDRFPELLNRIEAHLSRHIGPVLGNDGPA